MAEFSEPIPEADIEYRKIDSLVEQYEDRLGSYDIVPVADAGFLLQSKKQRPMAGNDWFMFDYDDTLVGTTVVKEDRLNLYSEYAIRSGINATQDELRRVMDATDRFARWEDVAGGGSTYHAGPHMSALDWATNELKNSSEKIQNGQEISMGDEVTRIEHTLNRIKAQLSEVEEKQVGDPFYFNTDRKKLVLKGKVPWSKDIQDIFMQTMMNPPYYSETLEAASGIGRPIDSIHRTNVGLFTYGEPYYQLLKTFELLEKNPDFPLSQIWLTKVPKGEFIEELMKTRATQKTQLDYVPSNLGETEGDSLEDSISFGSGYPLGQHPHVIVIMDDSPKELGSLTSSQDRLKDGSGASLVVVRSRRTGGREAEKEWDVSTPYGELDFRSRNLSGTEVTKILQINRYLAMRNNLGEENPRVIEIALQLQDMGVTDEELRAVA